MRVNIYQEEMTDRVELVEKNGFTGVRFYLELPVALSTPPTELGGQSGIAHIRGPFMHKPQDDDSAAVTFWGKQGLVKALRAALNLLEDQGVVGRASAGIAGMRSKASSDADAVGYFDRANQSISGGIEKELLMISERLRGVSLNGAEGNALRTAISRLDSLIIGITRPEGR